MQLKNVLRTFSASICQEKERSASAPKLDILIYKKECVSINYSMSYTVPVGNNAAHIKTSLICVLLTCSNKEFYDLINSCHSFREKATIAVTTAIQVTT